MANGIAVIIMGVSGCGKSSVGAALAEKYASKFIDGDDLHPKANILKMSTGGALNDSDRAPWLERIRDAAFSLQHKNELGFIACSALKRKYRDAIREGNPQLLFLHLEGSIELIAQRMSARAGHFMPQDLLQSQCVAICTRDLLLT